MTNGVHRLLRLMREIISENPDERQLTFSLCDLHFVGLTFVGETNVEKKDRDYCEKTRKDIKIHLDNERSKRRNAEQVGEMRKIKATVAAT